FSRSMFNQFGGDMKIKTYVLSIVAIIFVFGNILSCRADTIRLKDGTVIRGKVVGFNNQQFTVLLSASSRGRQSQVTLYPEDIESIEFDGSTAPSATSLSGRDNGSSSGSGTSSSGSNNTASSSTNEGTNGGSGRATVSTPGFFTIRTNVRADNTANGWTNTGLVVKRGQRIIISANGRASLGKGNFSTPAGLPTLSDKDKLMRQEPTGSLIAVIGDDNDDFIFIGSKREFAAAKDGVLFLGVNEGILNDNSGSYDTTIQAEAIGGNSRP
ncbi:MAG: LecA/PA-IL family lectin, partial [Pyrinomonadaceae bacterium]